VVRPGGVLLSGCTACGGTPPGSGGTKPIHLFIKNHNFTPQIYQCAFRHACRVEREQQTNDHRYGPTFFPFEKIILPVAVVSPRIHLARLIPPPMSRHITIAAILSAAGFLGGTWLGAADLPKEMTTPAGIRMVLIPSGSFQMGDAAGKEDEKPVHKVTVDGLYMDACEVTQESFLGLSGKNPSRFRDKKGPVECVRWSDAARYCNARSLKEGLKPCYNPETWECDFSADGYRLPTEAEWEFACRAGSETGHFFKGGESQLDNHAWYRNNSTEKVHPTGMKRPNAFGLADMYGNVSEWCNDYYGRDYYANSPEANPVGPPSGDKRVLRGGNWSSRPKDCNSSRRFADNPETADICQGYDTYGFRCVRKAANHQ